MPLQGLVADIAEHAGAACPAAAPATARKIIKRTSLSNELQELTSTDRKYLVRAGKERRTLALRHDLKLAAAIRAIDAPASDITITVLLDLNTSRLTIKWRKATYAFPAEHVTASAILETAKDMIEATGAATTSAEAAARLLANAAGDAPRLPSHKSTLWRYRRVAGQLVAGTFVGNRRTALFGLGSLDLPMNELEVRGVASTRTNICGSSMHASDHYPPSRYLKYSTSVLPADRLDVPLQ